MTTFLDRIVSKALAGPDDRTAMRPRIDPGTAIPNATLNASVDGDIGEDTRPESEMEPVSGQTARTQLTGSLVTPETHGPAVLPPMKQMGREKPAEEPIGAEPRTRSLHPAEPSSAPSGRPTTIQPEDGTPMTSPELRTVHILREPVFPPTRRQIMRERQVFVVPGGPGPTRPGDRYAEPASDGRLTSPDVPEETDKAEDRATDSLPSPERHQRSRIVPRVALERGALDDVAVKVATPARRSLGYSAQARDANRDETTVHVTIGRLEIRAPQSVPAAAPQRTQTTREGHLEDYLKMRASRVSR